MTAGPMFVGGRVNKEILPVEFSYLLQKQIKPPPYVGGPPRSDSAVIPHFSLNSLPIGLTFI